MYGLMPQLGVFDGQQCLPWEHCDLAGGEGPGATQNYYLVVDMLETFDFDYGWDFSMRV